MPEKKTKPAAKTRKTKTEAETIAAAADGLVRIARALGHPTREIVDVTVDGDDLLVTTHDQVRYRVRTSDWTIVREPAS